MPVGRSDMRSRSGPFIGCVIQITISNSATAKFNLGHHGSKQAGTESTILASKDEEAANRGGLSHHRKNQSVSKAKATKHWEGDQESAGDGETGPEARLRIATTYHLTAAAVAIVQVAVVQFQRG
jgi:hypothetical protein